MGACDLDYLGGCGEVGHQPLTILLVKLLHVNELLQQIDRLYQLRSVEADSRGGKFIGLESEPFPSYFLCEIGVQRDQATARTTGLSACFGSAAHQARICCERSCGSMLARQDGT